MIPANLMIFGRSYYSFVAEPEYQAVIDSAIEAGFNLPPQKEMYYQNELVKELKADGTWNRLDELYVGFHSGGTNFFRINWKHPQHKLAQLASGQFVNLEGYRAIGATGTHLVSPINHAAFNGNHKLGDACVIADQGSLSALINSGMSLIVASNGGYYHRESVKRQCLQQGGGYNTIAALTYPLTNGLRITTRNASVNRIFENGAKVREGAITYAGTGTITPQADVNYNFSLMAMGTDGGGTFATIRLAAIGGNLTDSQCVTFSNAWQTYKSSILT